MDFTSIEMVIELDQPPHIVKVLVLCDYFTRHVMAYVTPNQTANTVANFFVTRIHLDLWTTGQAPE